MSKKIKWGEISKKGKNVENIIISLVGLGVAPAKKGKMTPSKFICSSYLQIKGNRYFPINEVLKHKKKLINLLEKHPEVLINDYKIFQKLLSQMFNFAQTIPQQDLVRVKNLTFLLKWAEHFKKTMVYDYNYPLLNKELSGKIMAILEKSKVNDKYKAFKVLSQAKKLSVIQQEKLDLLNFISRNKKVSLASQVFDKFINKHLEKYAYMGMFYFNGRPWQKKYLVDKIKDLKKKNLNNELKILNDFKDANQSSIQLFKKYKFNSYEKKLVELMKETTYSINFFDEVYNYYIYKSQPSLYYLAGELGITYRQLIEMSIDELVRAIKVGKKLNSNFKNILSKRRLDSAIIIKQGKIKIMNSTQAKAFYKREFAQGVINRQAELKGQVACQGKVTGRVVIFKTVADISKVKKGNIMVAVNTVPSFIPAMEKAGGIVTETGGLLSHAAIVSREMNIPCIVGINNVTKILKDGDEVEIDANKGIIKKLT